MEHALGIKFKFLSDFDVLDPYSRSEAEEGEEGVEEAETLGENGIWDDEGVGEDSEGELYGQRGGRKGGGGGSW